MWVTVVALFKIFSTTGNVIFQRFQLIKNRIIEEWWTLQNTSTFDSWIHSDGFRDIQIKNHIDLKLVQPQRCLKYEFCCIIYHIFYFKLPRPSCIHKLSPHINFKRNISKTFSMIPNIPPTIQIVPSLKVQRIFFCHQHIACTTIGGRGQAG